MYNDMGIEPKLDTIPQNILAVIPARGGSKGIVRKNARLVGGIPLVAHSILHARRTPAINRIVVSTDDIEIGQIAREYGAEVVTRPAEISGDKDTSESALLHVVKYLFDREGYSPDLVVFLQATSPLRRPTDIQDAITNLIAAEADSLFSACSVHGFVWRNSGSNLSSLTYDFKNRTRRQDAPEDLLENGSIYVFKPWVLNELNNRLGGRIAVHRMQLADSFQIDELADLDLVECLMTAQRKYDAAQLLSGVRLLVLDFDGVLTDNRVFVDQDGREAVCCSRGDGWGIARLKEQGVEVVVLSTEANPVVSARCRKLGLDCIQGTSDKLEALIGLTTQLGVSREEVAFVGNDENDLSCMTWVGVPIAVADAEPSVRTAATLVTHNCGGHGAVREVTDWLRRRG